MMTIPAEPLAMVVSPVTGSVSEPPTAMTIPIR